MPFLEGAQPLDFQSPQRDGAYKFIAQQLRRFGYARLGKADKGLVKRYLGKVTGISRAQMTRLIAQFRKTGRIHDRRGAPARSFPRRYTRDDVVLLAELDALYSTLSGPATRKLCERAYRLFGDTRFERLAAISNGHLYNEILPTKAAKTQESNRISIRKLRAVFDHMLIHTVRPKDAFGIGTWSQTNTGGRALTARR